MAEQQPPRTPPPIEERGALTGSGVIMALADSAVVGVAGGVAGAITNQALSAFHRPSQPTAPPAEPQSKVILPAGTDRSGGSDA
jgi:hypothetical protein